jgi:hypothetical protein
MLTVSGSFGKARLPRTYSNEPFTSERDGVTCDKMV